MDQISFWYKRTGKPALFVVASATVYPPDFAYSEGRVTSLHIDIYSSDSADAEPLSQEIVKTSWKAIEEEAEDRLLAPWNPDSEHHEAENHFDEEAVS